MHIYYIPCSLMASKSKRPKLSLPDPRELILQQKEQKGIGKSVDGAIPTLKDSNLIQLSKKAQQSIPQATKVVWLITKYGFEELHMLCRAVKNLRIKDTLGASFCPLFGGCPLVGGSTQFAISSHIKNSNAYQTCIQALTIHVSTVSIYQAYMTVQYIICCRKSYQTILTLSGTCITNTSATMSVMSKITVQSGLNYGSITTLANSLCIWTQNRVFTCRHRSRAPAV